MLRPLVGCLVGAAESLCTLAPLSQGQTSWEIEEQDGVPAARVAGMLCRRVRWRLAGVQNGDGTSACEQAAAAPAGGGSHQMVAVYSTGQSSWVNNSVCGVTT